MPGIKSYAKTAVNAAALLGAITLGAQSARAEDDGAIVVTGEREAESPRYTAPLADTPRSVTVIPAEILQKGGVTSLQEALRFSPGITLGSAEGGAAAGDRPFIRGVDSTNDVFVDGVRDSGSTPREIFNLEQIDISRGPGGAFAGRGATGGSVNLISKTPKPENFAVAGVTVGTDETVRLTADINREISDTAAFRLNMMHHDADVAGRDAVELSRWGVAPSVSMGIGTDTRVTALFYHFETDDVPDYGVPYLKQQVTDPVYGTIFYGAPIKGHDKDFYGLLNRDFRKTNSDIGTVKFEHDLTDNLTLLNTSRYGKTSLRQVVTNPDDSRNNVPNGVLLRNQKNRGVETETIANVMDLKGNQDWGGVKHNFDVGVEYSREKTHNQGYYVNGPGLPATFGFPFVPNSDVVTNNVVPPTANPTCSNPGALGAPSPAQYNCTGLDNPNPNDPWVGSVTRAVGYLDTTTEVYAFYAFDTLEFNEQWSLNLGVRYDNYRTKQTGLTAAAPSASDPNPALVVPTPLGRKDEFVNYQVGLVYKPVKEGTLYISYGTSTNPSGEGGGDASSITAATEILAPEKNKRIEAGVKWELFDSRLLATGAVFHTKKNNARVTDATGITSTIGNQEVNGVEFTATGQITPDWTLFAGYTWLHSEIKDGGFLDVSGVLVPSPANGKRFLNTPEHSLSVWTDYALTDKLNVGGGSTYMSQRYADANNRIRLPAYWRFDAMASYQLNDRVGLQLNLQNITDERYVTNPHPSHFAVLAPGRSASLALNVRF
ncbi:MAG: TonB-dependent receptor [Caulobacterales bacterium]